MAGPKAKKEQRQFTVKMRTEYITHVLVLATSPEEAAQKADACEWVDNGIDAAEMVNWNRVGEPCE